MARLARPNGPSNCALPTGAIRTKAQVCRFQIGYFRPRYQSTVRRSPSAKSTCGA